MKVTKAFAQRLSEEPWVESVSFFKIETFGPDIAPRFKKPRLSLNVRLKRPYGSIKSLPEYQAALEIITTSPIWNGSPPSLTKKTSNYSVELEASLANGKINFDVYLRAEDDSLGDLISQISGCKVVKVYDESASWVCENKA